MIQLFNYTELMEKSGKKYLFDSAMFEQRKAQLAKLGEILKRTSEMLRATGNSPAWSIDVIIDGSEGLIRNVKSEVDSQIKERDLPKAIAQFWRHSCVEEIPDDLKAACDQFQKDAARLMDGIPIDMKNDFSVSKNGVTIDIETVTARIHQGCLREITPEDEKNAKCIQELTSTVRELEYKGVNALELVGKYKTRKKVSDLELLRDIVTRTHKPGCLNVDYTNITPRSL